MGITVAHTGPVTPSQFKSLLLAAWVDVRFNLHPALAAVSGVPSDLLDTDGYTLLYPEVDEAGAKAWAAETVFEHGATTSLELVASLQTTSPTARSSCAVLHYAPSSQLDNVFHIVLVVGHWITDGRGAFKILNHLVQHSNNPLSDGYTWGDEVTRLTVPLGVATGLRTAGPEQVVPLTKAEVDDFLAAFMGVDAATRPTFAHAAPSADLAQRAPDVISDLTLSESDSAALLKACRAHGVTVTALLNVLFSMVVAVDRAALAPFKTVLFPFFAIHHGHALVEDHRHGVGLQISIAPFVMETGVVAACLDPCQVRVDAIWTAAGEANKRLEEGKSTNIPITFEHEIIRALLPVLLANNGELFYRDASPFVTSVGVVTPLFPQSADATWRVIDVANGFTARWIHPAAHFWEWRGRTTVRIVARAAYDKEHSIEGMKGELAVYIEALLKEYL